MKFLPKPDARDDRTGSTVLLHAIGTDRGKVIIYRTREIGEILWVEEPVHKQINDVVFTVQADVMNRLLMARCWAEG